MTVCGSVGRRRDRAILGPMPDWNPSQYLRFAGERTRPCRDLVARIDAAAPATVMDLGCGPGNSTAVLAERWPGGAITGLDSSADMLATARRDLPGIRWEQGDIAEWASNGGPAFDVVFSNAALQWVPEHWEVFPALLARAGILAVQIPTASDAPAQRAIRELAASAEWRSCFTAPVVDWHSHGPAFYYDTLAGRAAALDIWETEYMHVLDGPEGIVAWYRGTGLRPFLEALPEEHRPEFLAQYLETIRPAYPPRADGRILFAFRRLFLIGYNRHWRPDCP
jgi:trans-aconitate 2-methyltransferase